MFDKLQSVIGVIVGILIATVFYLFFGTENQRPAAVQTLPTLSPPILESDARSNEKTKENAIVLPSNTPFNVSAEEPNPLFGRMKKNCHAEIAKSCFRHTEKMGCLATCLWYQRSKLSEACLKEISNIKSWAFKESTFEKVDREELQPESLPCAEDLKKFCDSRKFMYSCGGACLRAQFDKISSACQKAMIANTKE